MGSDERKTEDLKTQSDSYEETVLEFLDQEIATSTESTDGLKDQQDDVEELVGSLLKQALTESDEPAVRKGVGPQDLDLLFSDMFSGSDAGTQLESSSARPDADPRFGPKLEGSGLLDKAGAPAHPQVHVPRQPAAEMPRVEAAIPKQAVWTETVRNPLPSPSVPETGEVPLNSDRAVAESKKGSTGRNLLFFRSSRRPAWSVQMIVVGAAFLCLLAGTGITYFVGFRHPASTQPSAPPAPAPATQTLPAQVEVIMPPAATPDPGTKATPARTPRPATGSNTPAVSSAANNGTSAAPRKDANPAPATPTAKASPAPAAATPVVAPEKPATAAVAPVTESPVIIPPERPAEYTVSPPPAQTLAPPAATLTPLISKAAPSLDGLTPPNRPAFQPASLPRTATPASVLTRVMPTYPDLARKTRTTGTVVVDVLIDAQGKVTKATAASGPAVLRPEAVDAVLRWRFKPATLDGVNVTSSSQVTIVFKEPK
ncbi:MAG: TonB family protein [Acidobacteriia bacterium]|nr:TonB family protein [Terriglobia bacterium]